jgi:RNA polymerase sigma-70 factor, ECF subfamily
MRSISLPTRVMSGISTCERLSLRRMPCFSGEPPMTSWHHSGQTRRIQWRTRDRARWDQAKIHEGIAILDEALALNDPGPYQVEAAISALHTEALAAEATDWRQIAALYGTLATMTPSMVVEVNRAVVVAMAQSPTAGLALLHRIEGVENYYPYHAARADLLRRTNQRGAAADAYQRALALCGNRAERAYLQRRLDEMLNLIV